MEKIKPLMATKFNSYYKIPSEEDLHSNFGEKTPYSDMRSSLDKIKSNLEDITKKKMPDFGSPRVSLTNKSENFWFSPRANTQDINFPELDQNNQTYFRMKTTGAEPYSQVLRSEKNIRTSTVIDLDASNGSPGDRLVDFSHQGFGNKSVKEFNGAYPLGSGARDFNLVMAGSYHFDRQTPQREHDNLIQIEGLISIDVSPRNL